MILFYFIFCLLVFLLLPFLPRELYSLSLKFTLNLLQVYYECNRVSVYITLLLLIYEAELLYRSMLEFSCFLKKLAWVPFSVVSSELAVTAVTRW